MDKHNDIEFDLVELLLFIKKKLVIVLLVAALFATAGYAYAKFMTTPVYTADARLHVFRENEQAMDVYSMQVVTALRKDVAILATGRNISQQVVEQLDLSINPDSLSNRIQVHTEESTRVLDITFQDTNPQRAADILNAICDITKAEMAKLMNEDVVKVVYYAEVPTYPSSASAASKALLFGVVGLVLVLLVLIVVFLMDDTIHTEEDAERYLGLSVLSSIPISEDFSTTKQMNTRRGPIRVPSRKR